MTIRYRADGKVDNRPAFLFDIFKVKKSQRKADPDYGRFRRLCKKHGLTYKCADDGFVDIECPDGTRFAIGEYWDQRVVRLEEILDTGIDPGHGEVVWPAKIKREG